MTRQLPAGTCIGHALSSVRNNIAYAFRISWPWFVIIIPLLIVLHLAMTYAAGGDLEANPGMNFVSNMIKLLVLSFAFASIAVNWHRYILLDEVPEASGILRMDDKAWRYFGNVLLIMLCMMLVGMVMGFPLGFLGAVLFANNIEYFPFFLLLIITPVIGVLALRLSVKLPAIALGRRDFGMKDAFAATRENIWPLLLIALFEALLLVGSIVLIGLLAYGAQHISPALSVAVSAVLQFILNWLVTIFSITVLTSLYGFFVEGRDF